MYKVNKKDPFNYKKYFAGSNNSWVAGDQCDVDFLNAQSHVVSVVKHDYTK